MFFFIIALLFSYVLGSVPFGLLLTRAAGLGDIRAIGSGNIGATNVLRTGNRKLAALTLLLDGLKGALAVIIVSIFAPDLGAVAAIGAMLGHLFPVWLKFKGGKGVATGIGVMLGLAWPVGVALCVIWLGVALFRLSSLAALAAFAAAPLVVMMMGRTDLVPVTLAISAMIFAKHYANIRRLLRRAEPKIGEKKSLPKE